MKFSAIAYPLILLMEILVFMNFIEYHNKCMGDFDQRQCDIIVNYACDAAIQMSVDYSSSIYTDYDDWGNISIDPEVAFNGYLACAVRGMGWADTQENRDRFMTDCLPFFCVAAYDGYYMLERTEVIYPQEIVKADGTTEEIDNKVYELIWTPKIPYAYEGNNGNSYFGLNLNFDSVTKFDGNTVVKRYNGPDSPTPYEQKQTVTAMISDACQNAYEKAIADSIYGEDIYRFYIPADSSVNNVGDVNTIDGPSVYTVLMNTYYYADTGTMAYGVGGSKIQTAAYCLAYEVGGNKFYTYATNKQKLENIYNSNGTFSGVLKVFPSARAAAKAGYYYDMRFID